VFFGRGWRAEGVGLEVRLEMLGECKGFLCRAPCPRSVESAEGRGWLGGMFEIFSGFP
jgi:hypothetical protein